MCRLLFKGRYGGADTQRECRTTGPRQFPTLRGRQKKETGRTEWNGIK